MGWNDTIYIWLIVSVLAIVAGVVHMYRRPNPFVPFGWGAGLIAVGLLAYLFSNVGRPDLLPEQKETIRNFFIIVAGIGANLLAGAAAQNGKKLSSACCCAAPLPAPVPAPAPVPVPAPVTTPKVPSLEPEDGGPQ